MVKEIKDMDSRFIKLDNNNVCNGNSNNKPLTSPNGDKCLSTMDEAVSSDRGQWSSGMEFLMSCISMSVGLGNVWRFPYIALENGGGAFLIPYLLLLFLIGRPLYYLEMIMGQFSGRGPIKIWKCAPALKGLGIAQLFSVSYIAIFYNYLMGISIYYLAASFSAELPWTKCNPDWGCDPLDNATSYQNQTWSELYYSKTVLNQSEGLWDINSISWKLVLCLVASWTLVYLSIIKGVASLGKVAYFTAIFPYLVLITLLIVSLTQDGAIEGVKYFFKADFEKLLDPIVWYRAVEQSFFSLAVCFGSLVMYSSYNNFSNNVNRDAIIISVLDTFTSLLAGSVIFAVLGTMAHKMNKEIKDVIKSGGPGLAFIAYPEGLSKINFIPQLWSVLFFVMLFTLGVGSSVSMVETILTCVKDEFQFLHKHKAKTALAFCLFYMLLGLPLTTDAGTYILQLLDNYGVGTAAFLYGIIEVCGIVYLYGLDNFCDDVAFMLKSKVSIIWKITWGIITPTVLIIIFVYGNVLLIQEPTTANGIPLWGSAIGWVLAGIALFQIPLWFVITVLRQEKNCSSIKEKLYLALQPTNDWGPVDDKIFKQWIDMKVAKNFNYKQKNSVFRTLDLDGIYPGKKRSLVSKLSSRLGSDNLGFVPDETGSMSSCQFKTSQRIKQNQPPKLLSTKYFENIF